MIFFIFILATEKPEVVTTQPPKETNACKGLASHFLMCLTVLRSLDACPFVVLRKPIMCMPPFIQGVQYIAHVMHCDFCFFCFQTPAAPSCVWAMAHARAMMVFNCKRMEFSVRVRKSMALFMATQV